jgi:hypothetical protein
VCAKYSNSIILGNQISGNSRKHNIVITKDRKGQSKDSEGQLKDSTEQLKANREQEVTIEGQSRTIRDFSETAEDNDKHRRTKRVVFYKKHVQRLQECASRKATTKRDAASSRRACQIQNLRSIHINASNPFNSIHLYAICNLIQIQERLKNNS